MLIAIDPGQHTGLAFRLDNDAWATVLADKMPDADERLSTVLALLCERFSKQTCTAVIIETFKTMGYLSKYGIETIELIGAVKGLCFVHNIPCIRQDPQHRAPFERQAKALLIERAKILSTPVSDHEVSALAHLLRYEYVQRAKVAHAPYTPTTVPPETAAPANGPITFTVTPVTDRRKA